MLSRTWILLVLLPFAALASRERTAEPPSPSQSVECAAEDGRITLPEGFCATVFADDLGRVRHLAIAENGDVYVAMRPTDRDSEDGGVLALRDTDGDGTADITERLAETRSGTGIALYGGHLYYAHDGGVVRAPVEAGTLLPTGPFEAIVSDLPGPGTSHAAKSAAIDGTGRIFVNIGAPSNSCQEEDRTADSPGQDPCPELENRGGIWQFDATRSGQTQASGTRFATGLRNTFSVAIHPETGQLWGAQHGRDQLAMNWSSRGYSDADQAELPAEEFVRIGEGDDFGWPYCYYDAARGKKVLSPEYGGDGEEVGRCAEVRNPVIAFPAHWAPTALAFYTAEQFPERYRDGAFLAFHGSWNRAPLPQGGYNVVFIPFERGEPSGEWEVFADGFAGEEVDPQNATHRPSGLGIGPDGSLYISDDKGGRIWRIIYRG